MEFRNQRRRVGAESYGDGSYTLDPMARDLLQRFCYMVYREYVTGEPIPKTLPDAVYPDWRAKLWWKFKKDYEDGKVSYQFELFDDEWVKPAPDLSRLAGKFSREV
jgi:hypothetical protein